MERETIIIIDAYAQIYRGFFAVRHLSNSSGQPSNAVFAIAKFLIRMHNFFPSKRGVFAFDVGKPAFRLELAPDYKANRSPMPDEMKSQIPYIKRIITAFGWPSIEKENYEADDLIAAIAVLHSESDIRIVSSDKDLAQLIDDRVKMLVPGNKGGQLVLRGSEEVVEKFGVLPSMIIDYLAMIGDASDNIPGLKGVGPKTAEKLLKQFGSIDSMLANVDAIENEKLRAKVGASHELLRKNIALVTLKSEAPEGVSLELDALRRVEPNWSAVREVATELELNSILRELPESSLAADTTTSASSGVSSTPDKHSPRKSKDDATQTGSYTPDLFD